MEGPVRKKKVTELRRQQLRNSFLLLFLSQGTPLFMAGDEFGNSQKGNNNAYCQDNEISWLNWNQTRTNGDLLEFVKAVIAFRKAHPVFHGKREPRLMDYEACGFPDVSYHGVKAACIAEAMGKGRTVQKMIISLWHTICIGNLMGLPCLIFQME